MSTRRPFERHAYHGDYTNPMVRSPVNATDKHIGIELEVVGRNSYQELLSTIPHPKNSKQRPLTECDASLPSTGLEIVFPPFSVASLKNKRGYFAKVLESLKPVVIDKHQRAGMHLNVAKLSTANANGIFMALLHNLPARTAMTLFKRTGGQYHRSLFYPRVEDYKFNPYNALNGNHSAAATYRIGNFALDLGGVKYIEVRLARSNVEHDEVIMIIKFLELAREFAETATIDMQSLSVNLYPKFTAWLTQKAKKNKRARELLKYLN